MSVPEHLWRFPTKEAIESFARRFDLLNSDDMQDNEIWIAEKEDVNLQADVRRQNFSDTRGVEIEETDDIFLPQISHILQIVSTTYSINYAFPTPCVR